MVLAFLLASIDGINGYISEKAWKNSTEIDLGDINCDNDEYTMGVAAFNVRTFGRKTIMDQTVKKHLIQIVCRYDLILIQEIRDSTGDAINELLRSVNRVVSKNGHQYGMALSGRLGRTHSKEQYAFLYRTDWLSVQSEAVYEDKDDTFEREPYYVVFHSPRAAVSKFAALGIHTQPSNAEREVSALKPVYESIVSSTGIHDVLLMGDFNAACSYVNAWNNVTLATDRGFYWLIHDGVDTTTTATECAYDRIVARGDNLLRSIVPHSAGTYRFDIDLNLDELETSSISDHYPVEVQIYSEEELKKGATEVRSEVQDARFNQSKRNIYKVCVVAAKMGYKVIKLYKKTGGFHTISIGNSTDSMDGAKLILDSMAKDFPGFLQNSQLSRAKTIIDTSKGIFFPLHSSSHYSTLADYAQTIDWCYTVGLLCDVTLRKPDCKVSIKTVMGKCRNDDKTLVQ